MVGLSRLSQAERMDLGSNEFDIGGLWEISTHVYSEMGEAWNISNGGISMAVCDTRV
jgi:hypothetical protein